MKIGTIRWMKKNTNSRFSSIKFHDWLLFILRCAIIICVVLILAALVWEKPLRQDIKKWALVDPEIAGNEAFQEEYFSALEGQGFEIRQLDYGFEKLNRQQLEAGDAGAAVTDVNSASGVLNIWAVVAAAALEATRPDSILIFTKGYQRHFRGRKKAMPIPTDLIIFPDKAPHFFIESARWWTDDRIIFKIGKTASDYTRISTHISPSGDPLKDVIKTLDPLLSLHLHQDTLWLMKGADQLDAEALKKADTLRVLITDGGKSETAASAWRAALHAISVHQRLPIEITRLDNDKDSVKKTGNVDWLVHLSGADSEILNLDAEIIFSNQFPKDSLSERWFTKQESQNATVFAINHDFQNHPKIAQSFPEAILEVMNETPAAMVSADDRRALAVAQMELPLPASGDRKLTDDSKIVFASQKLEPFIWLLVLVLIVAERIVSFKRESL